MYMQKRKRYGSDTDMTTSDDGDADGAVTDRVDAAVAVTAAASGCDGGANDGGAYSASAAAAAVPPPDAGRKRRARDFALRSPPPRADPALLLRSDVRGKLEARRLAARVSCLTYFDAVTRSPCSPSLPPLALWDGNADASVVAQPPPPPQQQQSDVAAALVAFSDIASRDQLCMPSPAAMLPPYAPSVFNAVNLVQAEHALARYVQHCQREPAALEWLLELCALCESPQRMLAFIDCNALHARSCYNLAVCDGAAAAASQAGARGGGLRDFASLDIHVHSFSPGRKRDVLARYLAHYAGVRASDVQSTSDGLLRCLPGVEQRLVSFVIDAMVNGDQDEGTGEEEKEEEETCALHVFRGAGVRDVLVSDWCREVGGWERSGNDGADHALPRLTMIIASRGASHRVFLVPSWRHGVFDGVCAANRGGGGEYGCIKKRVQW